MPKSRFGAWRVALLATLGAGSVASCGDGDDPGGSSGGAGQTGGVGGGTSGGAAPQGGSGAASGGGADGLACASPAQGSGVLTRPSAAKCESNVPRPVSSGGAAGNRGAGGWGGDPGCESDFDCTVRSHGFCRTPPFELAYCVYGCTEDSDCGSSFVCVCVPGDPVGTCHETANCKTDADCSTGCACQGLNHPDPCDSSANYSFACQTPNDTCRDNSDCKPVDDMECAPAQAGWECTGSAACGRPFLIDGSARVAARAQAACGWAKPLERNPGALTPGLRRELTEHYTQLGLMEHASVAAFARFTLELMSLGAPATLLEQTQAALADEIQHAKLCFGLASAYAGQEVGPGPLLLDGVLEGRSYLEILETALLEACIGETVAAAEAALSSEHADDPELRAVFARIASDEARHAELGWGFMRWALERADARTARQLADKLYSAIDATTVAARLELGKPVRGDAALLAHGVLTPRLRAEARLAAVAELLLPCAKALTSLPHAAAA